MAVNPRDIVTFRFLVGGIIVRLMAYIIMPRYAPALADWLYR